MKTVWRQAGGELQQARLLAPGPLRVVSSGMSATTPEAWFRADREFE